MKDALHLFWRLITSYGMAGVLLLLLCVNVYQGTLAQVEHGLYQVQKMYFTSYWVWPFPEPFSWMPMPGVKLLLILLTTNLICGGFVVIIRRGLKYPSELLRTSGVLVIHVGILVMLISSAIEHWDASDGHLTLYPNDRGAFYQSYHEWEIAVRKIEPGERGVTEHLIHGDEFIDLEPGEWRRFSDDNVPFEVVIEGFHEHCEPRPASMTKEHKIVDGFFLQPLPRQKENERNVAGAYVKVRDRSGTEHSSILWGLERYPWTVDVDGDKWQLTMRHITRNLPFEIVLDKFTRELHEGTTMASSFSSDVTRISSDGQSHEHKILMNEPLREEDFILYQASFGPKDAPEGTRLFSSLAVSWNPADQYPLISCIIIGAGMIIHFAIVLVRFIMRSIRSSRRAASGSAS